MPLAQRYGRITMATKNNKTVTSSKDEMKRKIKIYYRNSHWTEEVTEVEGEVGVIKVEAKSDRIPTHLVWIHYSGIEPHFWGASQNKETRLQKKGYPLLHGFVGPSPEKFYIYPASKIQAIASGVAKGKSGKAWRIEMTPEIQEILEEDYCPIKRYSH